MCTGRMCKEANLFPPDPGDPGKSPVVSAGLGVEEPVLTPRGAGAISEYSRKDWSLRAEDR